MYTSGPGDRPFEEEHRSASIAIVLSGRFEYRASSGGALMTPGSLLLGNPGQSFECVHAHGAGDRCIAFRFSPELVRLRAAALHVAADEARIIDAAGAAGFEDLSNFNHAFRAEFGVAPRNYRRIVRR